MGQSIIDLGSISGAVDLDVSRGSFFRCVLVGNATFALSNVKPSNTRWWNGTDWVQSTGLV
jgi:hypothetical protein